MIIVSGPDNSGKTSLINHLLANTNLVRIPKFNVLPPWEHPEEYANWIKKTLLTSPSNGIVDRCFIDELAYGPIMRGKVNLPLLDLISIYTIYGNVKPLLIITDPGVDSIVSTYKQREQYPNLPENLMVRKEYYSVIHSRPFSKAPIYIFNYNFDPDYTLVKSVIKHYLKEEVK